MAGEKMPESKPAEAGSGDKDFKLWAALCYIIPILVPIIVMLTDKKSDKKLMFHAWHGLVLAVVLYAISFVLSFVVIGIVCFPASWLLLLFIGYKAYTGEDFVVPTLTEFARKQVK